MKAVYRKMNEQILPPEGLKDAVLARLEAPPRKHTLRPLGAALALALVLALAIPVMAAHVPPIQELMFQVAPNVAARFAPIQESDTANGIRMEVVSASIHGTTAELYLSFQDLEGNRLDETTSLGNFWLSTKPFLGGSRGSISEPLRLNLATNTYYSMLASSYSYRSLFRKRNLTVKEICGDKITVHLEELRRNGPQTSAEIPITLTEPMLCAAKRGADGSFVFDDRLEPPQCIGFGGGEDIGWFDRDSYTFLAPGEPITEIFEDIAVTAMCYLDEALHVQIQERRDPESLTQSFAEFYLADTQENRVSSHRSIQLSYTDNGQDITYTELIFQVSQEKLAQYSLVCDRHEQQILKGPWRVTFPLAESDYQDGEDGSILPTAEYSSGSGISQGTVTFR